MLIYSKPNNSNRHYGTFLKTTMIDTHINSLAMHPWFTIEFHCDTIGETLFQMDCYVNLYNGIMQFYVTRASTICIICCRLCIITLKYML
jgi:hypothetical protein